MGNLRNKFERFCYRHQDKGIPNLMLYITLANALVYILSMMDNTYTLYGALCFDRDLILQGQVWRLLTCIFTSVFGYGNILFVAVGLICYFSLGRAIENVWGTFRFNLFYFSGLVLMDLYAMVLGGISVTVDGTVYSLGSSFYQDMGSYLNLSLFIAYATLYPDAHFLLMFVIPVKAWIFGLLDLVITLYSVFSLSFPILFFPHNLFPLVALANYFLFFGKDVKNLIPVSWQANFRRLFRKKSPYTKKVYTTGSYEAATATVKAPYTHRCTVCGRTDQTNPELEFRYCSRCNGYFCYCQDHISNHTHVE